MKTLPDKPSELLKLALADIELVEADPSYTIDMILWHTFYDVKCAVCAAGAVMAINAFRKGYLDESLAYLKIKAGDNFPEIYTMAGSKYDSLGGLSHVNRKEWKEHMCTIIGILEAEDL